MSLTEQWVVFSSALACCYLEFVFSVAKWSHILFLCWHWGFVNKGNLMSLYLFFIFVVTVQTYFAGLLFRRYLLLSFFYRYSLDRYWVISFDVHILRLFRVGIHFKSASSFSLGDMSLELLVEWDDCFSLINWVFVELFWFIC